MKTRVETDYPRGPRCPFRWTKQRGLWDEIGETYVRSQSFSSESAVKYLHVGRRKIQISPPLGEQDQSNALPQGRFYIDGALFFLSSPEISAVLS